MKIFIISLDMLVALPVLSVAMLLLFSSVKGTQSYLLTLGVSQTSRLNAIVTSQQIAGRIDSGVLNYSDALELADSVSGKYGLTAQLLSHNSVSGCGSAGIVCRLVTVSGNVYVLVVSYESTG